MVVCSDIKEICLELDTGLQHNIRKELHNKRKYWGKYQIKELGSTLSYIRKDEK